MESRMQIGKKVTAYKIRRKSDGLFSCGDSYRWNKTGKMWMNKANLNRHFGALPNNRSYRTKYSEVDDLEIVVYEYEVTEKCVIPFIMKVV